MNLFHLTHQFYHFHLFHPIHLIHLIHPIHVIHLIIPSLFTPLSFSFFPPSLLYYLQLLMYVSLNMTPERNLLLLSQQWDLLSIEQLAC